MDVGFSMSNSAPGEEPPFELAKKVIQKFVQRQVNVCYTFTKTRDLQNVLYVFFDLHQKMPFVP